MNPQPSSEAGPESEPTPNPGWTTRSRLVALGGVLMCIGVGIYAVGKYLDKPLVVGKPPEIETTKPRAAAPVPKVPFTDVTDAAKIHFTHYNGAAGSKLLPETMGGSVCVLDYDGDGWQDILFVRGLRLARPRFC